MSNILENNHKIIILFVFLIANSPLLMNFNGIYWDDWVFYDHDFSTVIKTFNQLGIPAFAYHIFYLQWLGNESTYLFRITVLLFYLISTFAIYEILRSLDLFNKTIILFISLIYVTIPIANSKTIMSISAFSISASLFYIAFYLLIIYQQKQFIVLRITILFIFYCSFFNNAVLVYYSSIIVYLFYKDYLSNKGFNYKLVIAFMLKNFDFILLPILFFCIRQIYFYPNGIYSNYNSIEINFLSFEFYRNFIIFFKGSFYGVLKDIKLYVYPLLIMAILLSIVYVSVNKQTSKRLFVSNKNLSLLFVLAIGLFLLATFPYVAVSKTIDSIYGWDNRFQMLLPLSIAIFFTACIIFVIPNNKRILILFLLVLFFSMQTFKLNSDFLKESIYQDSVIENFKVNDSICTNSSFIIQNNIKNVFVYNRELNFYEWTGMLRQAFGNDSKLMISQNYDSTDFPSYVSTALNRQYNIATWKYNDKVIFIKLNLLKNISIYDELKLIYLKYYDATMYRIAVKQLVELTILDCNVSIKQ